LSLGEKKKKKNLSTFNILLFNFSIAEKLGIIQPKNDHLNEVQWQEVKNTAAKREDFKQPCVICKEELGSDGQLIEIFVFFYEQN
jgi:hypothetical protein